MASPSAGSAQALVGDPVAAPPSASLRPPVPETSSKIGIEPPSGVRLSVDALVDAEALERVLSALGRRGDLANRAGIHSRRELAPFTGFLQADANAGFNPICTGNSVSDVAYWAHCRRERS